MQEALALVRRDLGPRACGAANARSAAAVGCEWIGGSRLIEVVASTSVSVPSRLPPRSRVSEPDVRLAGGRASPPAQSGHRSGQPDQPVAIASSGSLPPHDAQRLRPDLPDALFQLFTDLIEADVHEDLARDLVERVRQEAAPEELADASRLKDRLARLIEDAIPIAGPIQTRAGRRRLVALVGPTGVGKTTTIAKLAANYRLREKRRVGLITVDTYRIAAVEQLRTYADIIDLPMEIVATPGEMHQAVARMADLDLILMDTAGRSPRDEVKIQELKSMLAEAMPDEVHLVLSSVASAASAGEDGRAVCHGGHHGLGADQAGRSQLAGQFAAAVARQPIAAELPDARPERARRHRPGREPRDWRAIVLGIESIDGQIDVARSRRQANHDSRSSRRTTTTGATCGPPAARRSGMTVPLVVVAGGKGGVGATTIAVNLAVALARQGRRAVFVDADLDHGGNSRLAQHPERGSVLDVLAGRRSVHEVLERGPLGMQVLSGAWAAGAPVELFGRGAAAIHRRFEKPGAARRRRRDRRRQQPQSVRSRLVAGRQRGAGRHDDRSRLDHGVLRRDQGALDAADDGVGLYAGQSIGRARGGRRSASAHCRSLPAVSGRAGDRRGRGGNVSADRRARRP